MSPLICCCCCSLTATDITSNILVMSFPYSKEELANFQTKGRNDIEIVERLVVFLFVYLIACLSVVVVVV